MRPPPPKGATLRAYLLASHALPLLAPRHLRRRLARGKEDAARMGEKLGQATQSRPAGRLIWLHAVGLGEVLALRGLIAALAARDPGLSFLVTSSARSSAQVMGANLPARTQHQYLPLDAPCYLARFLDHWQPDLSVWAEQEVWPGAVVAAHGRGVPLALVNARLTEDGYARRVRVRGLYADLFARFSLMAAQDAGSAARLGQLGARDVRVMGSLKSAAPPLAADPAELARVRAALAGRKVWVAASTHPGDEVQAMAAQAALWRDDARWLLILVPRDVARADAVARALESAALPHVRRAALPGAEHSVWLADSYGELGLWYRLAGAGLIGGGFDAIGGHNPWEAAILNTAVLHGPDVANFATDYAVLDGAGAARAVAPGALAQALQADDLPAMTARATALVAAAQGALDPLARDLLALMGARG